jgi:hypothetical protein
MSNPKTLKPFQKGGDERIRPKPKGALSYKTIFNLAAREVAKQLKLGKEPEDYLKALLVEGAKRGLKGNYSFYKDILDRLYGQAKQTIETEEKKILVLTDEEDEEYKKD